MVVGFKGLKEKILTEHIMELYIHDKKRWQ